jgi:hypothetical protein
MSIRCAKGFGRLYELNLVFAASVQAGVHGKGHSRFGGRQRGDRQGASAAVPGRVSVPQHGASADLSHCPISMRTGTVVVRGFKGELDCDSSLILVNPIYKHKHKARP